MANDGITLTGRIKEKLIAAKRKWGREGRLLTHEQSTPGSQSTPDERRLPPGQREVRDWPVLDLGVKPRIDSGGWTLTIDGQIENPVAWDWAAFMDQPQASMVSDIHCVTAWSRFDNGWQGMTARHLLEVVRPRAGARREERYG